MSSIDEIRERIRQNYSSNEGGASEVTLEMRAQTYCMYSADYLAAARLVRGAESDQHMRLLMPWYQLVGQALELAMKACLAADKMSPPETHDLIALCKRVEERRFSVSVEHAHAHLVHLNHGYYRDLRTDDRFVARYGGGGSWAVPDAERLYAVCTDFISQAQARLTRANGEDPSR